MAATTRTTLHLFITRRDLIVAHARAYLAQRDPLALLAVLILVPIIVLSIGTTISRGRATPTVARPTPPLPIIIIATAEAQPMPAPVVQVAGVLPNTFSRAVVAYDAPNGNPLGAIEQGRVYAVLARYGADWLQADVVGSGVVWLKSADVFDLPSGLADLAPPPAPQIVVVSAPAAPAAHPAAVPDEAVPTPAPSYAITSQQEEDFYAPPHTSLEERQKLIGDDPNALACGGSSLCGGMTNAEAQQALDRERLGH